MRAFRAGLIAFCYAVGVAACAQTLPPPVASFSSLEALRNKPAIPHLRVGNFTAAQSIAGGADEHFTVRSVTIQSPYDNSFAHYLGKTIEQDLLAAGKLDSNSDFVLEGILTKAHGGEDMSVGDAIMSARFTVTKNGATLFDKELSATAHWDSAFVGAEAIPAAIHNYTSLFDKLAVSLFQDADFGAAFAGAPTNGATKDAAPVK